MPPYQAHLILNFTTHVAGAADPGDASSPSTAARLLYRRAPRWDDWARLVAAVELSAPLTSLHVVAAETCAKAPSACPGGSPSVAGGASGRLTLLSPSDGVLAELSGPSGAAVTAIASFPGVKKGLVVVAGRGDGTLTWHRLAAPLGGAAPAVEAWGLIPTQTKSAWTQLTATPWTGGKHGGVNIGGVTASGAVAWGRVRLEEAGPDDVRPGEEEEEADAEAAVGSVSISRRKKPLKKKKQTKKRGVELHWDTTFSNGADVALTATPHKAAVQVVTAGGEVAWGAMIAKPGYTLRPPFPCTGWARHGTAELSAAALTASISDPASSVAPRHFAASWSGRLLALHTSATPGTQVCHVTGASAPLVAEAATAVAGGGVLSLTAMPGYVLAVTAEGQLTLVNVTGPFLRPSMAVVLQTPLEALASEVSAASGSGASIWWPWKSSTALKSVERPLVAAAGSGDIPAAPGATGVAALQLGPSTVALYATALPYRPISIPKPSVRGSFLGSLQPFIIAIAVGTVLYKQRAQRRQKEAFFDMVRARAGEGSAGGSYLDRPHRGRYFAEREHREQRRSNAGVAQRRQQPLPAVSDSEEDTGAGAVSGGEGSGDYERWLHRMEKLEGDADGDSNGEISEAFDPVLGMRGGSATTEPFPWEERDAARRAAVAARFDAIQAEHAGSGSGGHGNRGAARKEVSADGLSQRASRGAAAARQVPASPQPLIDRAPMPRGISDGPL